MDRIIRQVIEAALDQPHPTPELQRALEKYLKAVQRESAA